MLCDVHFYASGSIKNIIFVTQIQKSMETMLQIENLTKSFGDLVLFEGLSLGISEGERVGLIGRNGSGKTTLLNIVGGIEDYDSGQVVFRRGIRTGYLVQTPKFKAGTTVLEACFQGDTPPLRAISAYESAVASGDADAIHRASEQMDALAAWDYEARAKEILTTLHITEFDKTTELLSGGQLKRVALAGTLIAEPQLLIMDEPTNHLDLDVTEWLEEYLAQSRISLLMVTHDRYFLDRVCNRIAEIENRSIYIYKGNYAYYVDKKNERLAAEASSRESDRNLYRRELDWMRRMPQARGSKAQYRIDSFRELEQRLQTQNDNSTLTLDVTASRIGKKIFELTDVSKSFGTHKVLTDFSYNFARMDKLGIVGNNGTGKTTFLRMLLGEVKPDSGKIDIGQTVRFGYYSQQGMQFDESARVIDVVTDIAEHIEFSDGRHISASQFLQMFLFSPSQQYDLVAKLSGGERRRLYLCTVLMHSPNFLILDEPTNDLDIPTLQVLEGYLRDFNGCVIVVSHDRYFMDKVADHLLVFEGNGVVRNFPSTYSDYIEWRKLKTAETVKETKQPKTDKPHTATPRAERMTFKEKREFEAVETELTALEAERKELESALSGGTLNAVELTAKSTRIGEVMARIDTLTDRWLELSEKA